MKREKYIKIYTRPLEQAKREGGLFFYPLEAFSIVLGMVAEVSIKIKLVKSANRLKTQRG